MIINKAPSSLFVIIIQISGIQKLLTVASYLPEYESNLKVTENTKLHVACCLSAIYDDISSDKERQEYISVCDKFIRLLFLLIIKIYLIFFFLRELSANEDQISKVEAVSCLSILLQVGAKYKPKLLN